MKYCFSRYCLFLLILLIGVIGTSYGQEQFQKGVLYIKINEQLATSLAANSNQFQFSKIQTLEKRIPLKSTSSNARTEKSILDGIYKVYVSSDTDIAALCEELSVYSNVIYAEPLPVHSLQYIPNDPSASNGSQGYLEVIKVFEAWDVTRGSSNITIGIIDSGLDFDHEDISSQVWINENDPPNGIDDDANGYVDDYRGYDFSENDTSALTVRSFHGNRVGGIASAATDNEIGIAGIGFNSKIAALKAYNDATNLVDAGYEAILYAADMGFDVVNLSYGSASFYSQAGQDIITYAAIEKDMVIVAAAGNSNKNERYYPAAFDHVLSVGATNLDDTKAGFSTYHASIDLSAPGSNIYSTYKLNGYATDNGTSYSSPLVAGAAALVKSVFPDYSALQIMEQIRVNTDPINDINPSYENLLGYGRLNIQKAVTNTESKSVRVFDLTRNNNGNNETINPGDTLSYTFKLVNYLNPTDSLSLSFSSTSQYVSFSNPTQEVGTLQTFGEYEVFLDGIKVSFNTPEKTDITVKITLSDGAYEDYKLFTFKTNEDKQDLDNGSLSITLDGEGQLGSPFDTPNEGFGLRWKNDTRAYRMGLLIRDGNTTISDNLPNTTGDFSSDLDFGNVSPMVLKNYSTPDHHISAIYDDQQNPSPIGIVIEQNSITNENEDFLIQDYRLANKNDENLNDLSIGLYVDWELSYDSTDRSYYDADNQVLISYKSDSSIFTGIAQISNKPSSAYSLDLANKDGNTTDLGGSLADDDLLTLLNDTFESAGMSGSGNNIAAILTVDSIDLAPKSSQRIGFVIALGNSKEQVLNAIERAKLLYESFIENPEILETQEICPAIASVLDPSSESQYNFYTDPYGNNLIGSGLNLALPPMVNDTFFYVTNIDSSYEKTLQRIEVPIVESNARFAMSADTLYLDEEINSIHFTDQSPNAVSWSWDFGNGNQTTLQNPTLNYFQSGSFTISMTAVTSQGCISSTSQQLLVVERPDIPTLLDQKICLNDSIRLFAINADTISLYALEDALTPIATNRSIWIKDIAHDTTFYVSSRLNGVESLRVPLMVSLDIPDIAYQLVPYLASETQGALLINTTDQTSKQSWYLDNVLSGSDDTLALAVSSESLEFSLVITNTTGCSDSIFQKIDLAPSAIPEVSFDPVCAGETVILSPNNGTYFAFYRDAELTDFISKGESIDMVLSNDTLVYVVGLDSILPSSPLEVNITTLDSDILISAFPDTLYLDVDNFVSLSTDKTLSAYQWYLNSELIETVASPTIFLNEVGNYEVKISGINMEGCATNNTLSYLVLATQKQTILSATSSSQLRVYPNPSDGLINIEKETDETITITDMMGKAIFNSTAKNTILSLDLSAQPNGIYFIHSDKGTQVERLIIAR